MDKLTKEQRSYCMSQIRSRDTKAEIMFRKLLWSRGFRNYRVKNNIFGKPDILFSSKKIAVFVDGCFWHKCPVCFVKPKSNNKYWDKKIDNNVKRDKIVGKELMKQGFTILRFWEHEIYSSINKCFLKFKETYENKK